MKILALDTSSIVATVAVMEDEKLIAEIILNYKKTHSEKLMPMIEEILNHCEMEPKEIDVFAASLGPGSFTGLRIGMTTVKAMAQALNKPVVGVPTLEGLAYNVLYADGLICPIIDAQRDMVYTALYRWEGTGLQEVMEQQVLSVEDLINDLRDKNEKVIFVGDAVDKFRNKLEESLDTQANFPPTMVSMPRAASIAQLAKIKVLKGESMEASQLVPLYMRKSQAEHQYDERMKGREKA